MNTSKKRMMYASIIAGLFLFTGLSVFAYTLWEQNKSHSSNEGSSSKNPTTLPLAENVSHRIHYHRASDSTFSTEPLSLPFSDSTAEHSSQLLGDTNNYALDISSPGSTYWRQTIEEVLNAGKPDAENSWIRFTSLPTGSPFYLVNDASRRSITSFIPISDISNNIPSPVPEPAITVTLFIGSLSVAAVVRKRKNKVLSLRKFCFLKN